MAISGNIKTLIPNRLLSLSRKWISIIYLIKAASPLSERTCPLCGYRGYFSFAGRPPRIDAQCPECGSLERHRLFWLWFTKNHALVQEPILHFAAEKILEQKFRPEYKEYRTADLLTDADLRINIESINLSPGSINTVICNHVLEHVSDNQALREIYKVLSVGGILIVSVPLIEGWEHTYENSEVTDPILRELHFGQADHVRYYGRDFRARLRLAGFGKISEITAEGKDVIEYGLCRGEKIFLCEK